MLHVIWCTLDTLITYYILDCVCCRVCYIHLRLSWAVGWHHSVVFLQLIVTVPTPTTSITSPADSSYYSRRRAEDLIKGGKIHVNGAVALDSGRILRTGDCLRIISSGTFNNGGIKFPEEGIQSSSGNVQIVKVLEKFCPEHLFFHTLWFLWFASSISLPISEFILILSITDQFHHGK